MTLTETLMKFFARASPDPRGPLNVPWVGGDTRTRCDACGRPVYHGVVHECTKPLP